MIINTYTVAELEDAFGIDMSAIDMGPVAAMGVGAAWGRVAPGVRSDPHQHDEIETFVIVAGAGDLVVDAARRQVAPGTVIQFEPFETHHLENTGDTDLVFATFYWRDADRAVRAAGGPERRRFGQRPVFVFSSPPTPNGDLHLGHLSGPYLGADVFVRFQRMNGADAWHIAGSDDFQSYVAGTARREGRAPAETAAHYSAEILATHGLMDIGVDQYTVSNQDPTYPAGLRAFFSRIVASAMVTPTPGRALFDGASGRYLYEVDVTGGCPTCGDQTGGNMCETCGEPNFCVDLTGPRATASAAGPREGPVTRYSLPLHRLRDEVAALHHLGRVPVRVKELADRVFRRDRIDLAVTHPSEWGVAPAEPGVDGQVIWIWVDLAYRFLHGIEALGRRLGKDWRADAPRADWKIVHFLGFDNTFYHAILSPALYRLANPEWTPDIDYHLNEFYRLDGAKFSTSRNHAIWGKEIVNAQSVDAVRFYLARTRPEGRSTNFELSAYHEFVRTTLHGTWQRWLNDLGGRVEKYHGGLAPDAGVWTPEHTAFLARLENRLSALTGSLGQDGFSLNQAAEALNGIVTDAVSLAAFDTPAADIEEWRDESRTAIALELAAAQLLARGSAALMPRFAARLAAALGQPEPTEWPRAATLVAPGTRVDLARQVFFAASAVPAAHDRAPGTTTPAAHDRAPGTTTPAAHDRAPGTTAPSAHDRAPGTTAPARPSLLPWLGGLIRTTLRLPAGEPVAGRTPVALGMESLQAIAVQYQILEQSGVDVQVAELLGDRDVAALADHLARQMPPEVVASLADSGDRLPDELAQGVR